MGLAPPRRAFAGPLAAPDAVMSAAPPAPALALNPAPRPWDVFREQLGAVRLTLRREAAVAGGLALLFTAFTWMASVADGGTGPFTPGGDFLPGVMALLVPMAVWKEEGPRLRGYHHGMPVARSTHAMVRAGAGLAWLLLGVGVYLAWLGALSGGFDGDAAPWRWVAPFAGAAVIYLFSTALTLRASHPWWWLGGGCVALVFLTEISRVGGGVAPLADAVWDVFLGRYGLETVLMGRAFDTGYVVVPALPSLGAWVTAVCIWVPAALGTFLLAAHRQPES